MVRDADGVAYYTVKRKGKQGLFRILGSKLDARRLEAFEDNKRVIITTASESDVKAEIETVSGDSDAKLVKNKKRKEVKFEKANKDDTTIKRNPRSHRQIYLGSSLIRVTIQPTTNFRLYSPSIFSYTQTNDGRCGNSRHGHGHGPVTVTVNVRSRHGHVNLLLTLSSP